MRRTEMLKTREVLRLKYEVGLSLRAIAQACNCGKSTVSEILDRARKSGVKWPTELNDLQLVSKLYPPKEKAGASIEPDMEYIFKEMKRPHVTLMKLWEEYKSENPEGIMYTQFCERYRTFKTINKISMHKEHKAGEEVEVDWCGSTIPYYNVSTKEDLEANIFVAVLPASSYPFVYAYEDMKKPSWIDAHVRAYEYFGGVPKITIPDNTKTAVQKTDLFDPVLNKSYYEMACYYRTTIIPARAYKPKDKAADENAVGNVSQRILVSLRNRQFFSIEDINDAIEEELIKLVERPFQKIPGNRREAFEEIDRPCLQPLPEKRYEYAEWKEAKVQFNYHVEYEKYFYSVHYTHTSKMASIRATKRLIEVFIDGERVAAHLRNYDKYKRYTTLPEHMPENHRIVSGWSSDRFLEWAGNTGPYTKQFIGKILDSREYAVQAYRACMGIMKLTKGYDAEIAEQASQTAIEKNVISYKYYSIILKQIASCEKQAITEKVITNKNVRGNKAFIGGGIDV